MLAAFFDGVGPTGIKQGFNMDGTSLGGDDSLCMIATAAAAMVPGMAKATVKNWYACKAKS